LNEFGIGLACRRDERLRFICQTFVANPHHHRAGLAR
jgi:hypothetical protein